MRVQWLDFSGVSPQLELDRFFCQVLLFCFGFDATITDEEVEEECEWADEVEEDKRQRYSSSLKTHS